MQNNNGLQWSVWVALFVKHLQIPEKFLITALFLYNSTSTSIGDLCKWPRILNLEKLELGLEINVILEMIGD